MKAYKGFAKDMKCRGYKYEEGQTYETDEAKLCESGFHACEDPIDCFRYYNPGSSVYHEVDLYATDEIGDDSKRVGTKIKIGAALDVAKICKLHFEYTKERCTNDKTGGNWSALNGGDRSALNGGNRSALNGGYGSVMRGGVGSKFVGGMWAVFACEMRNEEGDLTGVKTAVVDGETLKPGVWYALKNGEFAEVEDND